MKDSYELKSDRYGYTHRFVKTFGNNNYMLKLQEKWMHMQISVDPASKKLVTVDPDGGPVLFEGWKNHEIIIRDIYQIGLAIFFSLEEVKKENPQ